MNKISSRQSCVPGLSTIYDVSTLVWHWTVTKESTAYPTDAHTDTYTSTHVEQKPSVLLILPTMAVTYVTSTLTILTGRVLGSHREDSLWPSYKFYFQNVTEIDQGINLKCRENSNFFFLSNNGEQLSFLCRLSIQWASRVFPSKETLSFRPTIVLTWLVGSPFSWTTYEHVYLWHGVDTVGNGVNYPTIRGIKCPLIWLRNIIWWSGSREPIIHRVEFGPRHPPKISGTSSVKGYTGESVGTSLWSTVDLR